MNPQLASQILAYFQLESQVESVHEIDMGHLHRVYQVKTTQQEFIVKKLMPRSCDVQDAFSTESQHYLENYTNAEKIAAAFSDRGIPAVNAYFQDKQCRVDFDDVDYAVYPYIKGNVLAVSQLSLQQIESVGQLIFKLHGCQLTLPAARSFALFEPDDAWGVFLQKHFPQYITLFSELTTQCRAHYAEQRYDVISHRDITCRNVLWQQERYDVIDWELAGWVDPAVELLAAAINFSMPDVTHLNADKFMAILQGYSDISCLRQRFDSSFYGVINIWLDWAQYNMILNTEVALSEALYSLRIIVYICQHQEAINRLIFESVL